MKRTLAIATILVLAFAPFSMAEETGEIKISPVPKIKNIPPKITVSDKYPVLDRFTKVAFSMSDMPDNVMLTVVYRPNGAPAIEKKVSLGKIPSNGIVNWKPEEPGNTRIMAWVEDKTSKDKPDGKTSGKILATWDVATCYPSPPIKGVLVMLIAGIILFGGAGYSLNMDLKEPMDQ